MYQCKEHFPSLQTFDEGIQFKDWTSWDNMGGESGSLTDWLQSSYLWWKPKIIALCLLNWQNSRAQSIYQMQWEHLGKRAFVCVRERNRWYLVVTQPSLTIIPWTHSCRCSQKPLWGESTCDVRIDTEISVPSIPDLYETDSQIKISILLITSRNRYRIWKEIGGIKHHYHLTLMLLLVLYSKVWMALPTLSLCIVIIDKIADLFQKMPI